MKQSVRLGRVAGIPVGAHWSVAVILVIVAQLLAVTVLPGAVRHEPATLYWAVAVSGALLFLASLLAHELAHALVARRNGVAVRSITLWMLGGVAHLEGDPPSVGADLRIALAGPAASVAAGGMLLAAAGAIDAAGGPRVVAAAAAWLGLMNLVLQARGQHVARRNPEPDQPCLWITHHPRPWRHALPGYLIALVKSPDSSRDSLDGCIPR